MAKNKGTVYLAYVDDEIASKQINGVNSTTNKVGGAPDWPDSNIVVPRCPQCSGIRPLIAQLYCPLENSSFHRSLYVFACPNPNCSKSSKNWLCIRVQKIDTSSYTEIKESFVRPNRNSRMVKNISWCNGADDWDVEGMCDDLDVEAQSTTSRSNQKNLETNGNVLDEIMNNVSDDDDDSNSMENEAFDFARMQIAGKSQLNCDEADEDSKNANLTVAAGEASGGFVRALGEVKINGAGTCAEIERDEADMVHAETPNAPKHDIIELFKPTLAAIGPFLNMIDLVLKPFFLSVDEEHCQDLSIVDPDMDDHIRDLYLEYKLKETTSSSQSKLSSPNGEHLDIGIAEENYEMFEKSIPAHGDVMLFHFISTLQRNPGQIIRYSRDMLPLLIAPIMEPIPRCEYCDGETICEVQILPTIIPFLQAQQNNAVVPIEFGNVLIYTCLKSCWDTPDRMRYEKVIVQEESQIICNSLK